MTLSFSFIWCFILLILYSLSLSQCKIQFRASLGSILGIQLNAMLKSWMHSFIWFDRQNKLQVEGRYIPKYIIKVPDNGFTTCSYSCNGFTFLPWFADLIFYKGFNSCIVSYSRILECALKSICFRSHQFVLYICRPCRTLRDSPFGQDCFEDLSLQSTIFCMETMGSLLWHCRACLSSFL